MSNDQQEKAIREAAYRKWEQAGRPEGDELTFWLEAERELTAKQPQPAAKPQPITTSQPAAAPPKQPAPQPAARSAPQPPTKQPAPAPTQPTTSSRPDIRRGRS